MMEMKSNAGSNAVESLIEWSVVGMPVTLAETVTKALHGIASCGECRLASDDWVLFGEVMDVHTGPPFCAHVRRTSMLMQPLDVEAVRWPTFDILCPVRHRRVDFSPGMWIGIVVKPGNRLDGDRILADAKVTVWNVPSYNRCHISLPAPTKAGFGPCGGFKMLAWGMSLHPTPQLTGVLM